MSDENIDKDDETSAGRNRRKIKDMSRRSRPDPRKGIRFDTTGGDRRSGFARRVEDEGLRDADFED
jgi:hypothetical protein